MTDPLALCCERISTNAFEQRAVNRYRPAVSVQYDFTCHGDKPDTNYTQMLLAKKARQEIGEQVYGAIAQELRAALALSSPETAKFLGPLLTLVQQHVRGDFE